MWQLTRSALLFLVFSTLLAACGGGTGESDGDSNNESAVNFTGDDPSAGRLLAATQCAQCHGTDGYSVSGIDSIAGESYSELMEETVEDANEPDNLMGFHGGVYRNLTTELEAISGYLSTR